MLGKMVIEDEARLDGLPASAKAAAAANAESKGLEKGSYRFTLQFPSMFPILQYANDEGLRRTLWRASSKIASEGKYDNSELIWEILRLRQEKAEILGHQNFASMVLDRRMARNGRNALAFIEGLHERIKEPFLKEAKELAQYKAEKTPDSGDAELEPWDIAYYAEMQRQELYAIDDEALRPYFPVAA